MAEKQDKNNKELTSFGVSKLDVFHKLPQAALCSLWFEYSQNIIVIIDPKGNVVMVNQSCAQMLGGEPEDFIGLPLENVLRDEFTDERSQVIKQIVAGGQGTTWEREIRIRGEKRWLKTLVEPILESDGSVGAILVMAVDVTEEKRAEGEIRSLEERYALLFETAQEAILIADDSGNYVDANPFACELLGYTKEELVEIGPWGITPGINMELWAPMWRQFIEDGAMSGEYQVQCKDGTVLDLHYNAIANFYPGHHLSMLTDITDQKKAERSLQASEERYRALFQNTHEAIFIANNKGQVIDANPKFLEMFGGDETQLGKINYLDLFLDKKQLPVIEKYWELLMQEGSVEGVLDIPDLDGEVRHIQFYGIANITPEQHLFVIKDITARKNAEHELIASEERYSHLVQESPSTILVVKDGKYIFANPTAAEVLGYDTPQEVVGVDIFDSLTERTKELVVERAQRAARGERNEFTLLEILRPDGATRMIESISVPYTYDGEPAILVMGYDVTEREFTASRLSSFYQVAPIGAGVIVGRCFQEVNQHFCDITGYSAEELIGQSTRMLYFSDEEFEAVGRDKSRQIQEKGEATVETRFRRKDGEMINIVLSSMPLDPNDISKGLSATALDITQRKQAEEALRQLNEELEERIMRRTAELRQKNVDLEAFSYSISHDLRAPLRAINGFSQILLYEHALEWDQKAVILFERILAAGRRMDMLIEGMLLLAELGQQKLRLQPVDLGQLAEQIFTDLMDGYPDRKINAHFQTGKTIWADSGKIQIALSNLLTNAIQFTENCETAEVDFGYQEDSSGNLVFYVKDNGIGFNPEYYDKLFIPFQRLEENMELEGLGLGLAVVKKVIERHAGKIWAESEQGKGATFYFHLQTSPDQLMKIFVNNIELS